MYTEEYESKGFPFRDFLLKLILIIIFVFLLVWLLPKFIAPKVVNKTEKIAGEAVDLSPLTSQIFADNLERMKDAAISYYTNERLPKEVGESDTMTLSDMIGKKLIVALIDKNNKACDVEKSYVKITKMDDEYLLKVNLKDSEKEDYILVHLGCYDYCDSYLCAKKTTTDVPIKASKPSTTVPVKDYYPNEPSGSNPNNPGTNPGNPSNKPSDEPTKSPKPSDNPTNKPTVKPSDEPSTKPSPSPTPSQQPGYVYEYQKRTGAEFTKWTSWSNWSKTSCSTQAYNCNDSDITCLRKVQLYSQKEKVGTYDKKYSKTRDVVVQTGSYQQKACSKYDYVIINNTTYATTTTRTYSTVNTITKSTVGTVGGWTYNGRASYTNPPRDTASTHYEFVGADYSYCDETCTTLPRFFYDSYTYTGGLSTVTNTTSTPGQTTTSSSTSSSTSTKVTASCGSYEVKTIPIYGTITVTEMDTRREPLYGTVCYMSEKTRKLTNSGKIYTKWSKYNDRSLLDSGWYYTGAMKVK